MGFFDKTFHLCFFWDHISTLSCYMAVHRAGSQLKIAKTQVNVAGNILSTRRSRVVLVTNDDEMEILLEDEDLVKGEIESQIVDEVVRRHKEFIRTKKM